MVVGGKAEVREIDSRWAGGPSVLPLLKGSFLQQFTFKTSVAYRD